MITSRTVLVLGSGASYPYYFPLGRELSGWITAELGPNGWVKHALRNCGITQEEMDACSNAFIRSRLYSIDSFLAKRPEFAFVAKAAIAGIIKVAERPTALLGPPRNEEGKPDRSDDWYRYLWSKLSDSWEHFDENQMKVITFNYDRSLEQYLLDAMVNTFGKTEDQCGEKLCAIPVEHVYGSVDGPYGVPVEGKDKLVDYFAPDVLRKAAGCLKVIPEGKNEEEHLARCRKHLLWAERICYLGFSFDPLNLEHLDAARCSTDTLTSEDGNASSRLVVGTALGLTCLEALVAAQRCGVTRAAGGEGNQLPEFLPLKCEALLRRKLVLG